VQIKKMGLLMNVYTTEGRKRSTINETAGGSRKKKLVSTSEEPGTSVNSQVPHSVPSGAGGPTDVLDMPVDPNEPTYCLCHQVSFGEMIGCDNPEVSEFATILSAVSLCILRPSHIITFCILQRWTMLDNILLLYALQVFYSQCPIEWFHFQCVGLTSKPKGKW
jgi:hypothetical protein